MLDVIDHDLNYGYSISYVNFLVMFRYPLRL